jgi:hypothetical protein
LREKRIRAVPALLFVVLFMGCDDPFALREGEPPEDLPDWWITPVTPQLLLDDLRNLYENQASSLVGRLLAEDYTFFGNPIDVPVGSDGLLDKDEEEEFSRSLLDGAETAPTLLLSPDGERQDRIVVGVDATLYRHYVLEVQDPFEPGVAALLVAEGDAAFEMAVGISGTEWEIVGWYDEPGDAEWSWGLLKFELMGGR